MFAFLNFAGGYCEFRFYHHGDHVRVERWHQKENPGGCEMVQDETFQPNLYSDTLRAMIAIADEIE